MADMSSVKADGHTGKIAFDGAKIVIERPGIIGKIGYGGKPTTINVNQVVRVQFVDATMMKNDTIAFITPGHVPGLDSSDPNTVIFTKRQAPAFLAMRDAVWDVLRARPSAQQEMLLDAETVQKAEAGSRAADLEVCKYGQHSVYKKVYVGPTINKPVAGASATFDSGADTSRPTLTRIGAGALLAGPIGAVGGALLKKNTSKCYVTVIFADGDTVIIEGPAKDEMKMRQFAADVNRRAAN